MFAANATVGVVLAACGSWGALESCTLCLAPEHGFLHPCLVSLDPLKCPLGPSLGPLRWLCIKHGCREKLPPLSFLLSPSVDFIP